VKANAHGCCEQMLLADNWPYPYSREKAAYPTEWVKHNKFWVSVARVDDAYGTAACLQAAQTSRWLCAR